MIKLDVNHSIIQSSAIIQEISKNFLQAHGLNYFQYLRCYRDGRVAFMLSDYSLFASFIHLDSPLIFSSFGEQHAQKHTYWFLWDEELDRAPVKLARDTHNFHHGLTLLKRYHDYYDMIAVAMPNELHNASSYYMTRLPAIEKFMVNFANHAPELFLEMTDNAIVLPDVNRDINYQNLCLSQGTRFVFDKDYVTGRELQCLQMRLNGYSYKEIAQILQISPRTVETYLQRVKTRSGISCRNRLQVFVSENCVHK